MASWYKQKSPTGIYYTPFPSAVDEIRYIGDGHAKPTPKEIVEFLKERQNSDQDWSFDQHGVATIYEGHEKSDRAAELPAGAYMYRPGGMSHPERLIPVDLRNEGAVDIDGLTADIKRDIADFLANEPLYREDNSMYKIGFLLYGPPGNGKTTIIRNLLKYKFPEDAVTIFLYNLPSVEFCTKVSESLKSRLKIFVFEELMTVIDSMPLHMVLNFLDGEQSIDKSIVFATTNYPEKMPANLVDRPSRFDKRYKLGNPKSADRTKLLEFYLKRSPTVEELAVTRGLSIASLKEATRLVRIRKLDFTTAVKTLKDFSETVKKEFAEMKQVGFAKEETWDD